MDRNVEFVRQAQVERTMKALAKNRIPSVYAPNCQEAVKAVQGMLTPGDVITCGGSMTLAESGVRDLMKSGAYEFLDREEMPPEEVYRRTFEADVFLTSANAITEEGELYNVDGNGNRVGRFDLWAQAGDRGGGRQQDRPQPGGRHRPGQAPGRPCQRRPAWTPTPPVPGWASAPAARGA